MLSKGFDNLGLSFFSIFYTLTFLIILSSFGYEILIWLKFRFEPTYFGSSSIFSSGIVSSYSSKRANGFSISNTLKFESSSFISRSSKLSAFSFFPFSFILLYYKNDVSISSSSFYDLYFFSTSACLYMFSKSASGLKFYNLLFSYFISSSASSIAISFLLSTCFWATSCILSPLSSSFLASRIV